MRRAVWAAGKIASMVKSRIIRPSVEPTLTPQLEAELRQLIADRTYMEAIKRLRDASGLSISDSKAWVMRDVHFERSQTPCPYCSQPLRSKLAEQCLECGMDWHNPNNVVCHK